MLKFADSLSTLINIYDTRAQFLALRAGLEQAVKVLREAAIAVVNIVGKGVTDLIHRDQEYGRQHTLGLSFL